MPIEDVVAQIVQYIDFHYAESITLNNLSEMFHGSPYHLQRMFKRVHGLTPAAYIVQTRMNKACQLLTQTLLPVMDIGSAVGIHNPSHFSTQFLKQTGNTPTIYRQLNNTQH